jgi:hypothetical protein
MTNTLTKNYWILTLDEYQPVLVTAEGDMVLEAEFSLAEEAIDSGIRLHRLVDFIRESKHHIQNRSSDTNPLLQFVISYEVVEQITYLAYWKDYRLEFRIDKVLHDFRISAYFLNQPPLSCVLDQFAIGMDPSNELQAWLNFLCNIISEHVEIWQIHLVVHKSIYNRLAASQHARVFIEIETEDSILIPEGLPSPSF